MSNCEICGEAMPDGEEMFKFHGYSGPCPKPPLKTKDEIADYEEAFKRAFDNADRLAGELSDARDQIEGLKRSMWLVLRATSIGRPLHIPRPDVEEFNPNRAILESWTEPNGDHVFRAAVAT